MSAVSDMYSACSTEAIRLSHCSAGPKKDEVLHRISRSILFGQAYYAYCVRALGELEAAEAALQSGAASPRDV
jgi:hypothetical protein